jgi:HrpA-like RNA helicase
MTDGTLLQQARRMKDFAEYKVVMIDEAHERPSNIVLLLGLLTEAVRNREKKDGDKLRLVMMSAAIGTERFLSYFSDQGRKAHLHHVQGKGYSVSLRYVGLTILRCLSSSIC